MDILALPFSHSQALGKMWNASFVRWFPLSSEGNPHSYIYTVEVVYPQRSDWHPPSSTCQKYTFSHYKNKVPFSPPINLEISAFFKTKQNKKHPYLQMATVAENIWCLGEEGEPWAPLVSSSRQADEEHRMLNLKEGGKLRVCEVKSPVTSCSIRVCSLTCCSFHLTDLLEYFIP